MFWLLVIIGVGISVFFKERKKGVCPNCDSSLTIYQRDRYNKYSVSKRICTQCQMTFDVEREAN